MTLYTYLPLPSGSFTRMISLLPHRERSAPIECMLFHYNLAGIDKGRHHYEALSYTWGIDAETHSIRIDGCSLSVTENLYTALSYLRDPQLERMLWVDAVCINQKNKDEKARQIPFMRAIYAQADRVIVWLGQPYHNCDNALETIRYLAEDKVLNESKSADVPLSKADKCAYEKLLEHDWFRRIWVLQEVGVARCIVIQCGYTQVNGITFCEGLSRLHEKNLLPEHILPVIPLIHGSIFRPRHTLDSPGTRSIGELINMYNSHLATVPHDKIYALLGLCSDDPDKPCLRPNYDVTYHEVAQRILTYVFEGKDTATILPGTYTALIKSKGWILGSVMSVEKSNFSFAHQTVDISYHKTSLKQTYETEWGCKWKLQASAIPIRMNDIVCVLQGVSKPIIIRLSQGRTSVIMCTVTLQSDGKQSSHEPIVQMVPETQSDMVQPSDGTLVDLVLTWDAFQLNSEINGARSYHPTERSKQVLNCLGQTSDEEALNCRKFVMEDIAVDILSRGGIELQLEPMKDLLVQSPIKIPVSERVLGAVAEHDFKGKFTQLLLSNQRETPPITEASVKAARDIYELAELLFSRRDGAPISEGVVLAAIFSSRRADILNSLYAYQNTLPVTEDVVQAAAMRGRGYELIQLLYERQKSLPISETVIRTILMSPRGVDILDLLYQYHKTLPISIGVIQLAVAEDSGGKSGKWRLKAIYKHQPDVVLKATEQDPALGVKIQHILHEIGQGPGHGMVYALAKTGKVLELEILLKRGGNPDEYNDTSKKTALGVAVFNGDIATAQLLLKYSADPNGLRQGQPPLWIACRLRNDKANNYERLIHILLKKKADPSISSRTGFDKGSTPLIQAVKTHKSPQIIRALVDNGADPGHIVNGMSAQFLAQGQPEILNAMEPYNKRLRTHALKVATVTSYVTNITMAVMPCPNKYIKAAATAGAITGTTMALFNQFDVSGQIGKLYMEYFDKIKFNDGEEEERRELKNNMKKLIMEKDLERFFPEDSPFIDIVVNKAVHLDRDPDNLVDVKDLAHLSLYQLVLYCDDSGSMRQGNRIQHLESLSQWITSITTRVLPNNEGIELRFINQATTSAMSKPTSDEVSRIIQENPFGGLTEIGTNLRKKVLEENVYKPLRENTLKRPVFVFILTDGQPQGPHNSPEKLNTLKEVIMECGNMLKNYNYNQDVVRFQIGQIGIDSEADRFLSDLHTDAELMSVLYVISERLDERVKEYHEHEDRLEQWLLNVLMAPLRYFQTAY